MLGPETPASLAGTAFGLNNSVVALGMAVGPFLMGTIAASFGAAWGLALAASPLLLAAVSFTFVPEPKT